MRQRLGIAAALLGDPGLLVLDEPANGLNPEGIVWLRTLVRSLAAEGPPACLPAFVRHRDVGGGDGRSGAFGALVGCGRRTVRSALGA